jgi:hypothetical protein
MIERTGLATLVTLSLLNASVVGLRDLKTVRQMQIVAAFCMRGYEEPLFEQQPCGSPRGMYWND